MKDNNISTLIHLGDIVDRRKYINYKTLKDFRERFVYRLWDEKIDTHVIIGNHDLYNRNDSDINSMSELFSTYDGKTEPWIYSEPTEVVFDGLDILFVPWMNDDNRQRALKLIKETKAQIVMGHLELSGFQMHRGAPTTFGDDPNIFQRFDKVMTGHYHHKSDNGTVFYLGAPYEMTWSDYQDPRGFHVFDTDTRELKHIRNPFRMYHKIFYNDKDKTFEDVVKNEYDMYHNTCVKLVIQEKTNSYWFDMVLDRLYKANPFNVSIVEDYSDNLLSTSAESTIDQAQDTMTILSSYIEGMSISNKEDVKGFMKDLYSSALKAERE